MESAFIFKKLVSAYIHPITIALEMIVFGIVMVGISRRKGKKKPSKRKRRFKRWIGDLGVAAIIGGTFFLYLCSIKPVSDPLIFTLEKHYPPLRLNYENEMIRLAPEYIVVLAGGERADEHKPILSRLSSASLARVIGGVQLSNEFPDATLVFTGSEKETAAMKETAEVLRVDPERIMVENESRDTKDHPVKLKPILGESEFLLVTSGYHMPRAMSLFHGQELEPVAAPCDLFVWPRFTDTNPYKPENFFPRVSSLTMTHYAFHEYLGLTWARLQDQSGPIAAKVDVDGKGEDSAEEKSEGTRAGSTIEL